MERTLEKVSWFLVLWILGYLLTVDIIFVSPENWVRTAKGYASFGSLPSGADWLLLGAFAAYSGAGGLINSAVSNWIRDKGFGMSSLVGYIPAAVGGRSIRLSASGKVFDPTSDQMERWKGWWRLARFDQYALWAGGAVIGMGLPALLVLQFIEPGTELAGWAAAAHIAEALSRAGGPILWLLTLLLSFWILFGTQLGITDGFVRLATDNVWAGSRSVRELAGGDVRKVYYFFLAIFALSGCVLIHVAQPLTLIAIGANMAGLNFLFLGVHTLVVNRKFLPPEVRPSIFRQLMLMLVLLVLFYGFFVTMLILAQFFDIRLI